MIRAVVFDFDGVIANSEPLHFLAFRDVLAERHLRLPEVDYYDQYLGFDDVGVFRAFGQAHNQTFSEADLKELLSRKAGRLEALEQERSILFPGAREVIVRTAAAYEVAIASGALRPEIVRVLERENLASLFPVIVAAGDTEASKPAPDPYLLAVRRLAESMGEPLAEADCVAVEDSRWGLESARAAGLRTIAIAHTYPARDLQAADIVLPDIVSLTSAVLCSLKARSSETSIS